MTFAPPAMPGVQRDPAGMAAHHLDDQRAVVRLGRRVQPVDRLHGDVDRGVEPEGVVGGVEVVVDRLRHADDVDAHLAEPGRHAEGVLAAYRDQRVDAVVVQRGRDLVEAVVDLERVGARRAEDRAAARQDAAHLGHAERHRDVLERALPAVPEPDELVAVDADALADDGADHRVQAGAVAPAGQHTDSHRANPSDSTPGSQQCCSAARATGRGCGGRRRARRAGRAAPAASAGYRRPPTLAQLVGEPRDGTRQRPHVTPQLGERDMVVAGHPRPQLDRLAGLGQEREQVVADLPRASATPGRPARAVCRGRWCAPSRSPATDRTRSTPRRTRGRSRRPSRSTRARSSCRPR